MSYLQLYEDLEVYDWRQVGFHVRVCVEVYSYVHCYIYVEVYFGVYVGVCEEVSL